MKASKHLFMAFALAAIIGLCYWAIRSKPLRFGIDLEGGSVMRFDVDLSDSDSPSQDLETMIAILSRRVDPEGLKNLEWSASGDSGIEVRMPAAKPEIRRMRQDYMDALEALSARNVTPGDIRRFTGVEPDNRIAALGERFEAEAEVLSRIVALQQRIEAGDADAQTELAALQQHPLYDRAMRFHQLAQAYDAMDAASQQVADLQQQIDELTAQDELTAEQAARLAELRTQLEQANDADLDARYAYAAARENLLATNVPVQELANVLNEYYLPPQIAENTPAEEVESRAAILKETLDEIVAANEGSAAQIKQAVDTYKAWANERGPLEDPQDLIRLLRRTGKLEFRIAVIPEGAQPGPEAIRMPMDQIRQAIIELQQRGPEAAEIAGRPYGWFKILGSAERFRGLIVAEWAGQRYLMLSDVEDFSLLKEPGREEWSLSNARPWTDPDTMTPAVQFEMDNAGADMLSEITSANIGEHMAILLDNEVYSAPVIRNRIGGTGVISGSFTPQDVDELVRILRSGSLPGRLIPEPTRMENIGPSLGAENIARGKEAAVIGMICVLVFMVLYYLGGGIIADIAVVCNLVLIVGAMCAFGVNLTLPGIAGIILTVGIAVDANVLIFERLHEEQQKPQSMRMAVKNAYDRALTAIIDGNITTLLVCVILGWVETTQAIRGFAITLGIGILFSLFTALVVTRWIFTLLIDLGILKKRLLMFHLIGVPQINWMGKRYVFWVISAVLIGAGLIALVAQGPRVLGIDFRGGSRAAIRFLDGAQLDDDGLSDADVESALQQAAERLDVRGMTGQNVQVNVLRTDTQEKIDQFMARYDNPSITEHAGIVAREEFTAAGRDGSFFDSLDTDGNGRLSRAELAELPETRFDISTVERDPETVRRVIDEAFGSKLDVQTQVDFALVEGERIPQLNILAGLNGITPVATLTDTAGTVPPEITDHRDGVLLAFTITDSQDAMTQAQLADRLRAARVQDVSGGFQYAQPEIVPLTPAEGDRWMSFALVVDPENLSYQDTDQWTRFAERERELLVTALETERALESFSTFDIHTSRRIAASAIVLVILAWAAIIIYLWIRFGNWIWGLSAVVCLIHDTLIVIGLIALSPYLAAIGGSALGIEPFKIDMGMIAAILTVIGYSVNDTIVVFDRIRENRGRLTSVNPHMINASINQCLSRTLLTSSTTLIVVLVMYIFGGAGIHGFNYALLAGIIFGTYSSVAIASPLLLGFRKALVAKVTTEIEASKTASATEPELP